MLTRIGVDTGGTFTDFVVVRGGRIEIFKKFSTPGAPEQSILEGLTELSPAEVIHGSTVATNALLERKGARVALLTTAGFEDVLVIGRQTRRELYNIFVRRPEPLVPDGLRLGVRERTLYDGSVETELDEAHLKELVAQLQREGIESAAVSLLFSFANPRHEQAVGRALAPLNIPISLSSQVLAEYREYERTSTTVINAYLAPVMGKYLTRLNERLRETRLRVMQSNGGAVSAAAAAETPVHTVLSGPAGGVVGAFHVASACGYPNIITFDMGGTSTDVALCEGQIGVTHEAEIDGLPVGVPLIDIHTVGAGGGSIAELDVGGALKVGPQSAGAVPGPICYGKGGEALTVTDANVILGRLPERFFLGGTVPLAVESVAPTVKRLRWTREWTSIQKMAQGVIDVVNNNMEQAIRLISVERGHDPRDFALVCFGGAGGLHAADLALALGVSRVVVPRFPGALSALGLLLADVQRDYSKSMLVSAEGAESKIRRELDALHKVGNRDMKKEGFAENSVRYFDEVDLRYQGQAYELTVPLGRNLVSKFHALHTKRYGYGDSGRPVELVSVRTRFVGRTPKVRFSRQKRTSGAPGPLEQSRVWFNGKAHKTSIYDRESLRHGHVIRGPAIVGEYSSTTRVERAGQRQHDYWPMKRIDPVQLEIFKSLFHAIAEEMGSTLRRTAFSPNIKERRDYSCALFNATGEMIAQGDHMPVHLGSMPLSVKAAIDSRDIQPGDMVILNDPYAGGTHLPDITLVSGVFDKGKLRFYVASRAHHSDVGGMSPGSMPIAEEIFQEGLRIPPVKLVSGGKINRDVWELILLNVRTPVEREGDLAAMFAANRTGERRLTEVVEKYGHAAVDRYVQEILNYSERVTRRAIAAIPNGIYQAEDFLDDDGVRARSIRVAVKIRIRGEVAEVDFSESDPQVEGSVNAVYAITVSAVFYVFRTLVDAPIPSNAGGMRPIRVVAPPGTIVNALPPAAVCGGNVETSQRIVDVLYKCLAQAVPGKVPAASQGTMNNLTFGGVDPRSGRSVAYYETVCGGMGARPHLDGISGVHTHMTNSLNTPVEAFENSYPARIVRYGLRRNSGGSGRSTGGDGVVREIRFLSRTQVTVLSDRRKIAPYGLSGGGSGKAGRNAVIRSGGRVEEMPAKFAAWLEANDTLVIETPGGGGWGES
jgi:5-oxoprolinase (ATP-hydrolysing)